MKIVVHALLILLPTIALGFDWPEDDAALDTLLRESSPKYRKMAALIEQRQAYRIETSDAMPLGIVVSVEGELIIRLHPDLHGARRATVLIWEIGNALQRPRFDELDRRVKDGSIRSHTEFGLRMELVGPLGTG